VKYRKFTIQNYRAITDPLDIDVERNSLIPVIGVNESGKTTILHALFAFDHSNDLQNEGRHLEDTINLYDISSREAAITAEISFSDDEMVAALNAVTPTADQAERLSAVNDQAQDIASPIRITRRLPSKTYAIDPPISEDVGLDHRIARTIVSRSPYILFFDDFRDSVDDRIEIVREDDESLGGWLAIVERLFGRAAEGFSVFDLPDMEERRRQSLLARINKHLNTTLTDQWKDFNLDDTDALELDVTFEQAADASGTTRSYLKFQIVETATSGDRYYFFVRDRSKGFFWFFNFVMKLEFNPKVLGGDDTGTIYLLDEPGSYLHSNAQRRLCRKLRDLSSRNRVLYCTHSHYLLEPEVIPLSSIKVANKDGDGHIRLIAIQDYKGSLKRQGSAFQPLMDALGIKPFLLDLTPNQVIVTEGMFDLYALEMFRQGRDVGFLPATGAADIHHRVSLLIAWRVDFRALWDNDEEGRRAKGRAAKVFGEEIDRRHFLLLPLKGPRARKRILQDLFAGDDLPMARRELGLPKNASFEKTIMLLYYDARREDILAKISLQTRQNFDEVFDHLRLT